jgi:hypothetical protein
LAGDHAFRTVIGRQNHTRKCDSLFPQESTGNVLFGNEIPPRRHSATRRFERSALTSPPTQLRPPMPQQACISLPTNADLMDVDPGPNSAIDPVLLLLSNQDTNTTSPAPAGLGNATPHAIQNGEHPLFAFDNTGSLTFVRQRWTGTNKSFLPSTR